MGRDPFKEKIYGFIKSRKILSSLISIVVAIAIILLPILIVHILFKSNTSSWLQAEWSAGDVLSYLGSIIGAIATIVAVILTIRFTVKGQQAEQKRQKEAQKLSIKPHLQTDSNPIYDLAKAEELADGKTIFVTYPDSLPDSFPSSTLDIPYIIKSQKNKAVSVKEYYILRYSLSNVGAGNAIAVSFYIDDMPKPFIPAFSLVVNTCKDFVFILKRDLISDKERKINFHFEYSDTASTARYKQRETIYLYLETDGSLNTRKDIMDLINMPEEIEAASGGVRNK